MARRTRTRVRAIAGMPFYLYARVPVMGVASFASVFELPAPNEEMPRQDLVATFIPRISFCLQRVIRVLFTSWFWN